MPGKTVRLQGMNLLSYINVKGIYYPVLRSDGRKKRKRIRWEEREYLHGPVVGFSFIR